MRKGGNHRRVKALQFKLKSLHISLCVNFILQQFAKPETTTTTYNINLLHDLQLYIQPYKLQTTYEVVVNNYKQHVRSIGVIQTTLQNFSARVDRPAVTSQINSWMTSWPHTADLCSYRNHSSPNQQENSKKKKKKRTVNEKIKVRSLHFKNLNFNRIDL